MRGNACEIRFRYFDEIAEDGVVTDLERLDPGRGDLALLELIDPTFSVTRSISQLIKIDIITVTENSAFLQSHRRIVDQRLRQFLRQQFDSAFLFHAICAEGDAIEHFLQFRFQSWDSLKRRLQSNEIARVP